MDQDKLEKRNERFLQLCYNVFEDNEQGKELLAIFKESLIEMAPVADPSKDANHAFFREGQNHVIRSIIANIQMHKQKQGN